MAKSNLLTHSYSGSDFQIRAFVDVRDVLPEGITIGALISSLETELGPNWEQEFPNTKPTDLLTNDFQIHFGDLQTITTSMASSTSAVTNIGHSQPADITRGQKTYAGTMIFTLLDRDPLEELFKMSSILTRDANGRFSSIDQIPKFNISIVGQNETLRPEIIDEIPGDDPSLRPVDLNSIAQRQSISKMIVGVRLNQFGETLSVDDFFTEQVYQYVCEWVSPWKKGPFDISDYLSRSNAISTEERTAPSEFPERNIMPMIERQLRTGDPVSDGGIDVLESISLPSIDQELAAIQASFSN